MGLFKKKTSTKAPDSDRLAERIASVIVARQRAIAFKVNVFINRYPRRKQKRFLWTFCFCWLVTLSFGIYQLQRGTGLLKAKKNFQPVHIGQAFDLPRPTTKPVKLTDSLTIKK